MSVQIARSAFMWCAVINYAVLLLWVLLFAIPHQWLYRPWARWSRLSAEQFDAINVNGIVLYKTGIILFNIVPFIALCIVG